MRKGFKGIIVIALVSMFSTVAFAEDASVSKPTDDVTPVEVKSATDLQLTPAEKLAAAQGIPLEQARATLLAAGIDPDALPQTDAEKAGFDPDEEVTVNLVQVWLRDTESQRLVQVYQGHGRYRPADKSYLFANGTRILPTTDINGHSDGSSVIGKAFGSEKRIVSGLMVASTRTTQAYTRYKADKNGNLILDKAGNPIPTAPIKVWLNVCVDAREGAYVRDCAGVWNLREAFDPSTADYQEMSPEDWMYEEMAYAASRSTKGDPSYFAYIKVPAGAHVSITELVDKALIEGKFETMSLGLLKKPHFVNGLPLRVLNKDGTKKEPAPAPAKGKGKGKK